MLKPIDFDIFLKSQIGNAKNFTWSEALYLARFEIHCFPSSPQIFENIVKAAEKMQAIRDIFQKQIRVTSWLRPQKYNEEIGGSRNSSHLRGLACDFQVLGMDADSVRAALLPSLEKLNLRMEDFPRSNWVHIDLNCNDKTPIEKRFFKP